MKKRIIIKEEDYDVEWEKTVIILRWEHDFEKKFISLIIKINNSY